MIIIASIELALTLSPACDAKLVTERRERLPHVRGEKIIRLPE